MVEEQRPTAPPEVSVKTAPPEISRPPNYDAEPIVGVVGELEPLPPNKIITHTVHAQCPVCEAHVRVSKNYKVASRWKDYGTVGVRCCQCGQRFAVNRQLVTLR